MSTPKGAPPAAAGVRAASRSRREATRRRDAALAEERDRTRVALADLGMPEGTRIRVDGERGVFVVRGLGTDGSITCVGGDAGHWRSFLPEWCFPATRVNRRGRSVPTTVPAAQRGLREQWRRGLIDREVGGDGIGVRTTGAAPPTSSP